LNARRSVSFGGCGGQAEIPDLCRSHGNPRESRFVAHRASERLHVLKEHADAARIMIADVQHFDRPVVAVLDQALIEVVSSSVATTASTGPAVRD
jgi:hypothetical protein